jgi:hypothetical protein
VPQQRALGKEFFAESRRSGTWQRIFYNFKKIFAECHIRGTRQRRKITTDRSSFSFLFSHALSSFLLCPRRRAAFVPAAAPLCPPPRRLPATAASPRRLPAVAASRRRPLAAAPCRRVPCPLRPPRSCVVPSAAVRRVPSARPLPAVVLAAPARSSHRRLAARHRRYKLGVFILFICVFICVFIWVFMNLCMFICCVFIS